jgi:ferredoxin
VPVVVDFDVCQSNGQRGTVAPEAFGARDDGFLYT